jgi:serine O-acetyltransferase
MAEGWATQRLSGESNSDEVKGVGLVTRIREPPLAAVVYAIAAERVVCVGIRSKGGLDTLATEPRFCSQRRYSRFWRSKAQATLARRSATGQAAMTDASNSELWRSIRHEARLALATDPVFGRSLEAAILDRADLGSVVTHQIGTRLGKISAERAQFARLAREAFAAAPHLVDAAAADLRGIAIRDPATTALLPPLLNFKGYIALQAFRVSNWFWSHKRFDLALLFQAETAASLQVSIHPSSRLGTSVFLDHATGIIVGAFVEIGDEVTIMQNVTVARTEAHVGCGPRIGRGVLLASGATVLGDIDIGDFAKVGAGAIVTTDVPAGCTAVGVPAGLTNCPEQRMLAGV